MILSVSTRVLACLVAFSSADAFFATPRAVVSCSPSKTVSPLTPSARPAAAVCRRDHGAAYSGGAMCVPRGRREATALCMSEYQEGMGNSGQYEMQELHVEFKDDGTIVLEVKGVKGEACREITEDLIAALGDVIHTENTSEYFEERVPELNIEGVQERVGTGWSYESSKPEW